jgi:hypothetical protein
LGGHFLIAEWYATGLCLVLCLWDVY